MCIRSKSFAYKVHPDQPDYYLFKVYYKSFLGIRVSDYFDSYSQAQKAKIKIFNKI